MLSGKLVAEWLEKDFNAETRSAERTIPNSGGHIAVHTSGHTKGSLCLYHPERHILLCGDALFNRHPMSGRQGLQEPPAMVTLDSVKARESISKLAKLEIEVLLCGHGEPILEKAGEEIKRLAKDRF